MTDLDGSLWDSSLELHAHTRAALDAAHSRQLPVLVATGRRRASAGRPLGVLGLDHLPQVLLNGALGVHRDDVFHKVAFEREQVATIVDAFAEHRHVPCAYVEHHSVDVFCAGEPTTSAHHQRLLDQKITRGDSGTLIDEHEVIGFSVLGVSPDGLDEIESTINAAGAGNVIVAADHLYGDHSIFVQPPGISKWEGIEAFCARSGLDPSRVAAVGDGHNDLEMLENAAIAFVPSDATSPALDRADIVIDPPGSGGWSQLHRVLFA